MDTVIEAACARKRMRRHKGKVYEEAFEDYLRACRLPYVAVHEARRAIGARGPVKAFDFIVYARRAFNVLLDVKGRQLGEILAGRSSRFWPNWSTVSDVAHLDRWQQAFGADFRAVLGFVYVLPSCVTDANARGGGFEDIHFYGSRTYGMVGVSLEAYQRHQRPASARWQTVYVPQRIFRLIARPISYFLGVE